MTSDKPDPDKEDEPVDLYVNRDSEDYKLVLQAYREGKLVEISGMTREALRAYLVGDRFRRFVGHAGKGMTTEELMKLTRGE
ncbi:hypothetical protein [Mesorhizobium sp. KR2-14]|uniref:hypothetical protein n=1 Tax=Mesorhizobium sp. KR2-14 TaxID=3156610 RepID=UPI0032B44937